MRHSDESSRIVITYPFPLSAANGGSRMTCEIANHLAMQGADVRVLSVEKDDDSLTSTLLHDTIRHVPVFEHPFHPALSGLKIRQILRTLLWERPCDLILSYFHDGAFIPSLAKASGAHFGVIATWQSYEVALKKIKHSGLINSSLRYWIQKRTIAAYRQADILFATSEFTKNELIKHVGVAANRITVCPLGVRPEFTAVRGLPVDDSHKLIFCGRIVPLKGIEDAITALGQLKARGLLNWKFKIFGSGDATWARKLAVTNRISEYVEIHGPVNDERLFEELASSTLAFMPSHSESFGLSIAEAQAAGLPVVAYASGSVPEIVINDVTGWLAEFRNIDQLAQKLEYALRHPAEVRSFGRAAREHNASRFRWNITAQRILTNLEQLSALNRKL